ncbi:dihydrofolate reductase family protein [Planomonospora venezuelensis]|uniref:Dihydrofolate reductase n=1 Tax=Planomonospora venezuelensis TaxID=1999 RepID=A0A841DE39_PLAVE|nr:dihydrofolate reductase family protein [Planomonospora venezuelensis]MBB5967157.1 dihydrofolate reductase [Planomonospora venezuelensis]GIN02925.1 deaminase reductase [Planomonospora venezuelensis]
MGKIVVTAFVTLDGVIQAPGFPDEDRDGGFALGGWTQRFADPVIDRQATESVLRADALLLGRRTYQLFAGYWPGADPADPRTARLNGQPKYVVSRTLRKAEWNNSTVLDGDAARQAARLKERYDEIGVWGSSGLVPALLCEALIDEFVLLTYPTVAGGGKRLFGGGLPFDLELVHTEASDSGVLICTYRRAASVPSAQGYGSPDGP